MSISAKKIKYFLLGTTLLFFSQGCLDGDSMIEKDSLSQFAKEANSYTPYTSKDVDKFKEYVNRDDFNPGARDSKGKNLLGIVLGGKKVINKYSVDIAKLLLSKNVKGSTQDFNGDTAMHHLFVPKKNGKSSTMYQGINENHVNIANALLSGSNQLIHLRNKQKETPLLVMIKGMYRTGTNNNSVMIAEEFIKKGSDPNVQDEDKYSPLYLLADLSVISEDSEKSEEQGSAGNNYLNDLGDRRFFNKIGNFFKKAGKKIVSAFKPVVKPLVKPIVGVAKKLVGGGGLSNLPIVGNLVGGLLGGGGGGGGGGLLGGASGLLGGLLGGGGGGGGGEGGGSQVTPQNAITPLNRAAGPLKTFFQSIPFDRLAQTAVQAYQNYRQSPNYGRAVNYRQTPVYSQVRQHIRRANVIYRPEPAYSYQSVQNYNQNFYNQNRESFYARYDAPLYRGTSNTPSYNTRQAPTYNTRQAPTYNTRQTPTYNTRQTPTYNTRQAPTYNTRQTPTYNTRQAPTYNTRRTPTYNTRRTPTYNTRRTPTYNTRRTPTYNTRR